jgi:serine/threonine protein kinase
VGAEAGQEEAVKEAAVLKSLNHECIVRFRHFWIQRGYVYSTAHILMEYFEQGSARKFAPWRHPASFSNSATVSECAGFANDTLVALETAHRAGVTHRDVKLDNVMMRTDPSCPTCGDITERTHRRFALGDFGIATVIRKFAGGANVPQVADSATKQLPALADIAHTSTHACAGTIVYLPPEIENGIQGPAGDVYATGVALLEMLYGRSVVQLPEYFEAWGPQKLYRRPRLALYVTPALVLAAIGSVGCVGAAASRPSGVISFLLPAALMVPVASICAPRSMLHALASAMVAPAHLRPPARLARSLLWAVAAPWYAFPDARFVMDCWDKLARAVQVVAARVGWMKLLSAVVRFAVGAGPSPLGS